MTTAPATVGVWTIDAAHSVVEFSVKHMMVSNVKGRFRDISGQIDIDEEDPSRSSVFAEIDVASVDTGLEPRDAHLRSDDFLNAEVFPKITFRSKRLDHVADNRWAVTGDLTIRDVTREVTLDAEFEGRVVDAYGKDRAAFSARTVINRKDYGVNWNGLIEAGGVIAGDTVKIALDIAAVREA